MKSSPALLGLLATVLLCGCRSAPPASSRTVSALRYRIVWAESAMDLIHGGGREVEELYFPDKKVGCTLVYDWKWQGDRIVEYPCAHFFHADKPRNNLTGLHRKKPFPITQVQLPRELEDRIVELAERDDAVIGGAATLGRELVSKQFLGRVERAQA